MASFSRGVSHVRVGADVSASGSQLLDSLRDAISQLNQDVTTDACSSAYSPGCRGVSTEVDALERKLGDLETSGTTLDANVVLTAASVDTSDDNVKAFAACVKKRESALGRIDRGTLAYCAIQVRDAASGGTGLPPSHTSQAWRDRWETWRREFGVFAQKYDDALPGLKPADAEVSNYLAKYTDFRNTFIAAGGTTTAPSIDEPWSLTTKIMVYGGVALALYLSFQLFLLKRATALV